jgi:DNA-binding LacI/PurR family transcriptional regulator
MELKKNITIKDVAEKSGFSVATVSAVINGKNIVSPKTKTIIEKAIEELKYSPNEVARSLKVSKTSSIAILVRALTNPFYLQVVLGLEEIAWKLGYEILFCSIGPNLEREEEYIDNLINRRVDGVVIATSTLDRQESLQKLKDNKIPYVFVNRRPKKLQEHEWFVGLDNRKASKLITEHLHELGAKRVAYLSGPREFSTFYQRLEGFLSIAKQLKMPVMEEYVFESDFTKEEGYRITDQLISLQEKPDAIFCSSDLLASGAYMAIKDRGLNLPEDILLVGIDNSEVTDLIGITTIDPQATEMGRLVGNLLTDLIENGESSFDQETLLEPMLVVRNSTKLKK